jgi:hypothetical protein
MKRLALLALLAGCPEPDPAPEPTPAPGREACADQNPERNLYWGDLHIHTAFSFDAFFEDVRLTPDDAYDFARGEEKSVTPLVDGQGTTAVRLERPLDFAAVTDHASWLGEILGCSDPAQAVYDSAFCQEARADGTVAVQRFGVQFTYEEPERFDELCSAPGFDCTAAARDAWTRIRDAADAAYDRTAACRFTTFVGYEWSGATGLSNLHRNVIFRNDRVPELPISYLDEPTDDGLWRALDAGCRVEDGCEALSIPHNSNLSNGRLLAFEAPAFGDPAAAAAQQGRLEPLMEIYQHKGSSECFDDLGGIDSAADPLCGFEQIRPGAVDCGDGAGTSGMIGAGCASRRDGLRGALLEGLSVQRELGVNPLKLGVIASTDTHLGTPGLVDEESFVGHTGQPEDTALERLTRSGLRPQGLLTSPGGLVAAWATSNDRDALFDAMARREVYGTSGPRIPVRFFGGDLPEGLCSDPDAVGRAYEGGVPMGGDLPAGAAPRFVVLAGKDPGTDAHPGADLERLQIVKGWVDDAGQHVRVYDVAGVEGPDVDLETCAPPPGAASLCGEWVDPDPDPSVAAWWYARVVEVPSCRWSHRQCMALPEAERPAGCSDPDAPPQIREMAWTSPIWRAP